MRIRSFGACALLGTGLVALPVLAANAGGHGTSAGRARLHALDRRYRTVALSAGSCAEGKAARARAADLHRRALRGAATAGPAALTHRLALMDGAIAQLGRARTSCRPAGTAAPAPSGSPGVSGATPPAPGTSSFPTPGTPTTTTGPAGGAPPPPTGTTPAPPALPASVDVSADPNGQLKFQQGSLSVASGSVTFNFTNAASIRHNFAIKGAVAAGPTNDIRNGASTSLTVTLPPGTYEFYCAEPGHEMAGMRGTLIVG